MDEKEREEMRVHYAQKAKRHNDWLKEKICEMIQAKSDLIHQGVDARREKSTLEDVLSLLDREDY